MGTNMFYNYCTEDVLLRRNKLLKRIHLALWATIFVSSLVDIIASKIWPGSFYFYLEVFIIILLLVLIRFEFWSTWYWVDISQRNWLKKYQENNLDKQKKFFTLRKHKAGEGNPLF